MYRILIAEDEPPILRMIKNTIEKLGDRFEVAKTCFNGEEAIEALKADSYDVVITDVKMPVVTGLELAEWISLNRPNIMIVFLSGHQNFSYARQAIQYKAFDYVLKPVSKAKLTDLMDRIANELDKTAKVSHEPEQETPSSDQRIMAVLMCAGAYLIYGNNTLLPSERLWTDDYITSIIKKSLYENESYMFFNANNQSERLLVVENTGASNRTEEIVESLYSQLCSQPIPVTFLYCSDIKFGDVNQAFSSMREQLIHRLILGKSQLICCDDIKDSYGNIGTPYNKEQITVIVSAIKNGKSHFMHENLADLFMKMANDNCTQEEFNGLLNVIADTYALEYHHEIKRKTVSIKKELAIAIAGFTDYESLINDVSSILMTMHDDSASNDKYKQLADNIEAFIKENYAQPITSDTLSKKFGFVPSYLSRIFKKSKGISTSEYLLKYRIETAKRMILDNPNVMIKEVADSVGFKESYYFSKTFKRETGFWPTEYIKANSDTPDKSKI